jgi:hypothetical protein
MSSALDPVGPAPETRSVKFLTLLVGCCAAPIVWVGQLVLGYGVTAYICYPGDHPSTLVRSGPLFSALLAFDTVALAACATGGLVSWRAWAHSSRANHAAPDHILHTGEGRDRFLAMWGLMSSLWFFIAVLFNAIASITVPPCPG